MIGSLSKDQLAQATGVKRPEPRDDISELAKVVNHNARSIDAELTKLGGEITMTNLMIKLICDELNLDVTKLIASANERYVAATQQSVEDHGDHPGEATLFGGS